MATHRTLLGHARSQVFDRGVCLLGLVLLGVALVAASSAVDQVGLAALVSVPLVVLIARFPIVLDGEEGGIEIGFDSCVLMFLLCRFDAGLAVSVWGIAVLATQLTSGKRRAAKIFNVGAGILAGGTSAALLEGLRGSELGSVRELGAIVVAAAGYFVVDYVLSAVSLALESSTRVSSHLAARASTWSAIATFVPLAMLGYLAAVVLRTSSWWMLLLLVVPLVTILVASRAVTRGREDTRRLTVLLEAAVRVQALHEPGLICDSLLHDARRLVRLHDVELRDSPPGPHETGSQLRRGKDSIWVVAPARDRARATVTADQHALDALAVLGADAFARLQLTVDMVHYARHDPLTDLPNRGILLDRVAHALHLARRRGLSVALLFIDLDSFKPVNDRFGHAAGDAVLVEVARRLVESTRESDTVARLGGDEFAVLLEDVSDVDVVDISDRILTNLARGAQVGNDIVPLGASIGIAYGDGTESGEALLRHADLAMYEAKSRGKAQAVSYEPIIGRARLEGFELAEDLRRDIASGLLYVVYQPVVATRTGRIVGVEALVRWRRGGVEVPTEEFIAVAETTGLVVPLGELVLATVAQDAAALRAAADGPISMSVNVAAGQLREPGFVDVVKRTLEALAGTVLVLEITERESIADDVLVTEAMRTIAALGVRFAIDDFGVGFSSISYLRNVPAHVVKIDASLSSDIDRDERACAVLAAVVTMGDALGLDVVVEGIERETQFAKVRDEVGAPLVQGFLLYRPMPLAALLEVVRSADPALTEPTTPAAPAEQPAGSAEELAPSA